MLRNILQGADLKGKSVTLSFDKLNTLMANTGAEAFSYGSFKQVYDSNSSIQNMIKNFDKKGLTLDTEEQEETGLEKQPSDRKPKQVSKMAKRATASRR